MSGAIRGIAVNLSASIAGFASGMVSAAGSLGTIRAAFDRATDSASAYKSLTSSVGELKLAGRETIESVQTAFAVARGELARFGRNRDVQVAIEIGREYVDEAWIKGRAMLQRLADRTGIKVGAAVVTSKAQDVRAWMDRQRRQLTKPITVRMELARRAVDSQLAAVRAKLDSLKQYRAVRITLAAVNATKMPVQAALATLGPLRKLAVKGVVVGLRATHYGIAAGVTKARAMLGGLQSVGSGVVSKLTSGFGLIGMAVGALGAYKLVGLVKSSMDAIDVTAKLSDRLGIATEKLIGLQYAGDLAGVGTDQLTGGLEKMLNSISDAATKGGAAKVAFDTLGLSAQQLATMTPDQAFSQIADALVGVENPAQRAALAMDVFGKSGQGLLPLMLSGSEGIAAAQKEAEKLGLTFSRVDAAKVEAANDAMTRLSKVFTGAFQSLAISVAPFVDAAATKLTELASSGQGVGYYVTSGFEMIVKGVAYTADYLSLLKAGFKLLQAGATYAVFGVVKSIDVLGSKFVDLVNLLPGVDIQWTKFTGQLADGLLDEAKQLQAEAGQAFDSFRNGDSSKAAGRFFDDIRTNSQKTAEKLVADAPKMAGALRDVGEAAEQLQKVSEALASLKSDVSTLGLTDTDKELAKLKELGATDQQLQQARGLLTIKDQINGLANVDTGDALTDYAAKLESLTKLWGEQKISLEQFTALRDQAKNTLTDKLADQAKAVVDSVKTPLETYNEEFAKLQSLLNEGFISKDIFDRAQAKAKATLDAATKKDDEPADLQVAAPKALRGGSAEAQRLAYDAARGVQRTMNKDEVAKKQLTTQEEIALTMKEVARNTKGGVALQEVDL